MEDKDINIVQEENAETDKKAKKKDNKAVTITCVVLIVGALLFLLYYHVIQPYISEANTDKYRELYHNGTEASMETEVSTEAETAAVIDETETAGEITTDVPRPEQMEMIEPESISPRFEALVNYNPDIRGWLTIPGTNIDYPVVQANGEEGEAYYLTHNIDGDNDKNGSVFIDYRTVLTPYSRVIVLNGHNMKSTGLMFHELIKLKTIDFYIENPVITFDTIYGDSQWKIVSLLRTNNNESQGERFNFFRNTFESDLDFMDFVHEIKMRSMFNCPVTVNENDTLMFLSTCTSEMNDMRFVIVARKVREDEDPQVDISQIYERENVLYPDAWYGVFGGEKPELKTFTDAYNSGETEWYDGHLFD